MNFEGYIYEQMRAALSKPIPGADKIYALSFLVYDNDDNSLLPSLTLGSNTEDFLVANSHIEERVEARWNYAYWPQNEWVVIGPYTEDQVELNSLRIAWLKENGITFDASEVDALLDQAEEEDDDDKYAELEDLMGSLIPLFLEICIRVAKKLHDEGIIAAAFGRPIPILIHELEYYDEIGEQTKLANPPGLADEFCAWIDSLGQSTES